MGSAELGLLMASPLLLLLLLAPPALSQFRSSYSTFYSPFSSTSSYSSYSPSYYRGQTARFSAPSSPPGPSVITNSKFSSFAPSYTGPPSTSYTRPVFKNRNSVFSNYLRPR